MIQITECYQNWVHPPKNKRLTFTVLNHFLVFSLFIDKTLTTVEKKVMIHEQKRNHGDEKSRTRQRWWQNGVICWDWNAASVLSWDGSNVTSRVICWTKYITREMVTSPFPCGSVLSRVIENSSEPDQSAVSARTELSSRKETVSGALQSTSESTRAEVSSNAPLLRFRV